MKSFILILVASLLALPAAGQQEKVAKQPNIVIINMDDMGYGDTEPYGATGYTTPNFNRLAREGMRFTHFYSAQAVCSPSRAALLTGCYPTRIGIDTGALMPWSEKALNPSEETIASLLKKSGYATGMLGKWHLGAQAPFLPLHYGFDSFYGIPYSNDMWPVDFKGNPVTDSADFRFRFPPLPIIEGDRQIATITNLEQQAALTTTLTEKAEQFIEKNRNRPFFLYLAYSMPHAPLAVSEKFRGKTAAGMYGDVMSEIDWAVGEVMDALDKTGLSKNTILIVTSDNGPWLNFGNHAGSSGGLREGKGTAWDGGTRVPCFIRWPEKVAPGSVCSQLLTNMDILPTIVAATNAPVPSQKIDGLNFLPLLTGKSDHTPREVFYVYYKGGLKLIRYKNWELVLPHKSKTYTEAPHGQNGMRGPTSRISIPQALYNLTHDPGTVYDVQHQYPEIVEKMLKFAEDAREELGDNITNRKGKNIREAAVRDMGKSILAQNIKDPLFLEQIRSCPGLVALWDFKEKAGCDRISLGKEEFKLKEKVSVIPRVSEGPLSGYAIQLNGTNYLSIPYAETGALNVRNNAVTVIAWVKWKGKGVGFIAGMWNEYQDGGKRQYGLFVNLPYYNGKGQVCGHISKTGQATPPFPYSIDYSASKQLVSEEKWVCVAFTYDGEYIRSYLNGVFEAREPELIRHTKGFENYPNGLVQAKNPYYFPFGIGDNGSDFTVGAVQLASGMGNFFTGLIGGLAVFNRALTDNEMKQIAVVPEIR